MLIYVNDSAAVEADARAIVVISSGVRILIRNGSQQDRTCANNRTELYFMGKPIFREQIDLDTLRTVKKGLVIDKIIIGGKHDQVPGVLRFSDPPAPERSVRTDHIHL